MKHVVVDSSRVIVVYNMHKTVFTERCDTGERQKSTSARRELDTVKADVPAS